MNRTDMISRIETHYASFWAGRVDDFDHQLAPDFVDDEAPHNPPGPDAVKAMSAGAAAAFPDMTVTIDDSVVEGNKAAVLATWSGTNSGPFMGHPPTGRAVTFQAVVIWRFDQQGRIVRRTAFVDRSPIMQAVAA